MPTVTLKRSSVLEELQNLPEVEYPDEVLEQWDKEVDIAMSQIAAGELTPIDLAALAAEHGLEYHG